MPVVKHDVLNELSFTLLNKGGIPEDHAHIVADHLVKSNLKGHDSHGVARVPMYVERMKGTQYVRWEDHNVLRDTPTIAIIDGGGCNGIVASTLAVDIAVAKARTSTVGIVGLHNTTHVGRLGDFPVRIADQGMVGMVLTNVGGVFMSPFGSADRRLPPNPLAMAVPRRDGPPLMLDMTLSAVAGGKIQQKKARNQPLPEGWLIDHKGNYVTDPDGFDDADEVGMPPLGGLELGHKGHGLSMMMEAIVGPLSMAGVTRDCKAGNGVLFIAIDIESFTDMDTYTEEVEGLVEWVTSARPLPGIQRLYAPGEIEEETTRKRMAEGIDVPDSTWAELTSTAEELNVPVPAI